jgi:hypothetical protein
VATLNGYDTSLGPAHGTSFRTASSRQRALTHVYISPSSGQQGFVNLSRKTALSIIEGQNSISLTVWQQLLLLSLQIRTQPHLGCCLAAATAAASAIFMRLCTNSATPYTSRQHMRSCSEVNGNCANRRSRLTTAVAGHGKRRWTSSSTGRSCIPKDAHRLQPCANQTTP